MDELPIFTAALGIEAPWYIKRVYFETVDDQSQLFIEVAHRRRTRFECQGEKYPVYDHQKRRWRHLNFFQHECYLYGDIPRVKTREGNVLLVDVPWAKPGSSFTLLFEQLVLAQLIVEKSASQVSLSSIEQQFVQKITQLVDTKSAKYISIGDIASYASDGLVTFTLPGLGTISSEAVHVEYQNPNDYIWSGKFTNQPGYFSIIAKPQGKVGFFQTSTRYFSIQPVNSEVSLLKEVDLSLLQMPQV
jgi:hypothetical protein